MQDLHGGTIPLEIPPIYRHDVLEARLHAMQGAARVKLLVEVGQPVHHGLVLKTRPPTRMRHQGTQIQHRERILLGGRRALPVAAFALHLADDEARLIPKNHVLLIAVAETYSVFAHTLCA